MRWLQIDSLSSGTARMPYMVADEVIDSGDQKHTVAVDEVVDN